VEASSGSDKGSGDNEESAKGKSEAKIITHEHPLTLSAHTGFCSICRCNASEGNSVNFMRCVSCDHDECPACYPNNSGSKSKGEDIKREVNTNNHLPIILLAEAWRRLCGRRSPAPLKPKIWSSVAVVVDGKESPAPTADCFVDGFKTGFGVISRDNFPEIGDVQTSLGLGGKIVVFGGGNKAELRGGGIRRLRLTDGKLTRDNLRRIHTVDVMGGNPIFKTSALLIQTQFRKFSAQKKYKTLDRDQSRVVDKNMRAAAAADSNSDSDSDSIY